MTRDNDCPCMLDDSTRIANHHCIYTHYLRHPYEDTNALVIIFPEGGFRTFRRNIEHILFSYIAAASDERPVIACSHYAAYRSLSPLITDYVTDENLHAFPIDRQTRFKEADRTVWKASKTAARLFFNHELEASLLDGILVTTIKADDVRCESMRPHDPIGQWIRRMKRSYSSSFT